jgi:hypothetical protein
MKKTTLFISFITIVLLFSQCYQQEEYSPIPKIDFRQIVVIDSIEPELGNLFYYYNIYFKIIDGDGNFGIDSLADYYTDSIITENFFAKMFKLENGQVIEDSLELELTGLIPFVPPVGLNEYYKAIVIFKLEVPSILPFPVKFDFYVLDNELNESNVQSTPWIPSGFTGVMVDSNNIIID